LDDIIEKSVREAGDIVTNASYALAWLSTVAEKLLSPKKHPKPRYPDT